MTPDEIYDQIDTEEIYIKFRFDNLGYQAGDVTTAKLTEKGRDDTGVHVTLRDRDDGQLANAWSDLGSFREMTAMEVIAHFADGRPVR